VRGLCSPALVHLSVGGEGDIVNSQEVKWDPMQKLDEAHGWGGTVGF
jgi:hypothetical protein